MSIDLRTLEIGLATLHEVRELRREVSAMAKKRGRTHGWLAINPRLIPWLVAAFLLAAGHMTVPELKMMIGLR